MLVFDQIYVTGFDSVIHTSLRNEYSKSLTDCSADGKQTNKHHLLPGCFYLQVLGLQFLFHIYTFKELFEECQPGNPRAPAYWFAPECSKTAQSTSQESKNTHRVSEIAP